MILYSVLKFINKVLGFFAGMVLFPAKSLLINLGLIPVAAALFIAIAGPIFWIGFVYGVAKEIAKKHNIVLGFLAGLLALVGLPIVASIVIAVAAVVYTIVTLYDMVCSFVSGAMVGMNKGLTSVLLSTIVDFSALSTPFDILYDIIFSSDKESPRRHSETAARFKQPTHYNPHHHEGRSINLGSLSTKTPSSYATASTGFSQADSQPSILSDRELLVLGRNEKLKQDKDVNNYARLVDNITRVSEDIRKRGTDISTPLARARCEITNDKITNPGLLVQSYTSPNTAEQIIVPGFTKVVNKESITDDVRSNLPPSVSINGGLETVTYEVRDFTTVNKLNVLGILAGVVRNKMDPVIEQLAEQPRFTTLYATAEQSTTSNQQPDQSQGYGL